MRTSTAVTLIALPLLIACSSDSQESSGGGTHPDAGIDANAQDSAVPDAPLNDAEPGPDAEPGADAEPALDAADTDSADDAAAPSVDQPLFAEVGSYATTLTASGDPADVYYPNPPDLAAGNYAFPIAALLQGAKVDKQYYASYAGIVASYGFVVVVPNHESLTITGSGLYAQPSVVNDVLGHMKLEQQSHPVLAGKLDVGTLVLLGHSYGGVVAVQALQGVCQFPFCTGGFDRPVELKAGALFATNMKPPFGAIPATDNTGWALALVQGDQDGKAKLPDTVETYEKVTSPPKALVTLSGVNHYGMCDVNNPPGADADNSATTTDQAVAVETAARWSALFLRAHALGDQAAATYVHQTGDAADPVVTVMSEQ